MSATSISLSHRATQNVAPPLQAKVAPWMRTFLNNSALVAERLQAYGSPLHVLNAGEFSRNLNDLLSPLRERQLQGGLYFARKANKLPWFVRVARDNGIGVDTASLTELNETLELQVPPERIVVTAVGKEQRLIERAVSAGCLIVTDNDDELRAIEQAAHKLQKTVRLGLRFSGFEVGGRKVYSRFGIPLADAAQVLTRVKKNPLLAVECLHAHLDRYDTVERATAGYALATLSDEFRKNGIEVSSIDLGGGILMRYLEQEQQWREFGEALLSSVKGERASFTFRNDGLGYLRVGDEVHGTPDLYPVWNDLSKERFIRAVLDHAPAGRPLHAELRERNLKLFFEPGRALLDNTGLTLATVVFRKRDTEGQLLLGLAMNRTNLRPFRAEFCSDPIFIPTTAAEREAAPEGAFLVGCLCGEGDFIFRRRLALPFLPEPGDIVAFANTAGYLAHHMEIGTHGDSLPRNVLYDSENDRIVEVFPGDCEARL